VTVYFQYNDEPVRPEGLAMRMRQIERAGSRGAWLYDRRKRRLTERRASLLRWSYTVLDRRACYAEREAFADLMLGKSAADVAALHQMDIVRVAAVQERIKEAMKRRKEARKQ